MLLRRAVDQKPGDEPDQSQHPGEQKRGPPASEIAIDEKHQERRDRAPDGGAAVEERNGPGALLGGEPFRHSFRPARIIRRLSGAQQKTERAEAGYPLGGGSQYFHQRIEGHADGQAATSPQPVKHPPEHRLRHRVCQTERDQNGGEFAVGPAILPLQNGRQNAQRLAIDIVDDRYGKEQSADPPAEALQAGTVLSTPLAEVARLRPAK